MFNFIKLHLNTETPTPQHTLLIKQHHTSTLFHHKNNIFHTSLHREHVETLEVEVDATMVATGRVLATKDMGLEAMSIKTKPGFIAIDEKMRVLPKSEGGEVIHNVYCIGDASGKLMLPIVASAQGISAIENICGREHS